MSGSQRQIEPRPVLAQFLFHPLTFEFAGGADCHQLEHRFSQMAVRQGLSPYDRYESNRLSFGTPKYGSDITLGLHLLQHLIPGKQMAYALWKATNLLFHHLAAGSIFQGIGYVILKLAIEVNSQSPSGQAVPLKPVDADIVHSKVLAQVSRQRLEEVLAGGYSATLCQEHLSVFNQLVFGDIPEVNG